MAIADMSIRPNSLRFRDAVSSVHERVRATAGDLDLPGESGESRALCELYEGSDSRRREQLHGATRSFIAGALLAGALRAHFSDATEARDIPGWVWADVHQRYHVWMGGCLVLPALLPDDWQRWSGDSVFLDREEFEGWLARHDFSAGLPAERPEAFDAADKPEPVRHRTPPEKTFVTLSEALSWIAFGVSFANERLIRAIDEFAFGPASGTSLKLENAIAGLTELALSGAVEIRGRYIENDEVNEASVLTDAIEPIRFHDFAQFDFHSDALRYGTGLTWTKSESISHLLSSKRADSIRSVTVNRAQLIKHFPDLDEVADPKPSANIDAPFEWSDFGADSVPQLERLHELAMREEWWTWPEAIAWVGSRDARNIATLRYWAIWWARGGDDDPTVALCAQAELASRYCEAPGQAKSDIINAIERDLVLSAGRSERHGKSTPLASGDWRGGTVVYADGGAQLVSATNRLVTWAFDIAVKRADLVTAFPAAETARRGTVPANRKLDHDEIIRQAASMKEAQPSLSKGSAAASIIADLGQNPRTKKPWDHRHIERIIDPLWRGDSPSPP